MVKRIEFEFRQFIKRLEQYVRAFGFVFIWVLLLLLANYPEGMKCIFEDTQVNPLIEAKMLNKFDLVLFPILMLVAVHLYEVCYSLRVGDHSEINHIKGYSRGFILIVIFIVFSAMFMFINKNEKFLLVCFTLLWLIIGGLKVLSIKLVEKNNNSPVSVTAPIEDNSFIK